jgi:hypothetical protein
MMAKDLYAFDQVIDSWDELPKVREISSWENLREEVRGSLIDFNIIKLINKDDDHIIKIISKPEDSGTIFIYSNIEWDRGWTMALNRYLFQ